MGDRGYQLQTGNMAFQPGLRAKEQGVFEGRCVQSGNAGQELRMRKAAPLPGVSLMETARNSFLRRREWLLLQVERGGGASAHRLGWLGSALNISGEYSLVVKGQRLLSNPSSPKLIGPKDNQSLFVPPHTPPLILFQMFCSFVSHGNCPEFQSWAGAWDLCPSRPTQKEPGLTLSLGVGFDIAESLLPTDQLSIFQAFAPTLV